MVHCRRCHLWLVLFAAWWAPVAGGCRCSDSAQCNDATPSTAVQRPIVLFIVLDTVRADHLSACGYHRPTSPNLERLAQSTKAWTCRAYTPGSWTLPSHASFFTGVDVAEHGADTSTKGLTLPWGTKFRPLGQEITTLAEQMKQKGYRTALVSGNPVLAPMSGLTRGFDEVEVSPNFTSLRGDRLVKRVEQTLDRIGTQTSEPVFLFVNIVDAHNPWPPVPVDLGWAPARPALDIALRPGLPFYQYAADELNEQQERSLRAHYTDVYDFAIFVADHTLGLLMTSLRERGWLGFGSRVVVTSDHGEFLVERGIFGHGVYVYEPGVRVPFLYLGDDAEELPEPFASIRAYDLMLGRSIEREGEVVSAVGMPSNRLRSIFGESYDGRMELSVALWQDDEKLLWMDGQVTRFDLSRDPNEQTPELVTEHPMRQQLDELARRAIATLDRGGFSDTLEDRLRAIGYVQ